MARTSRFSPEVRDRAVRMVREHESEDASKWAAIGAIPEKIGCSADALREWVTQAGAEARWRSDHGKCYFRSLVEAA